MREEQEENKTKRENMRFISLDGEKGRPFQQTQVRWWLFAALLDLGKQRTTGGAVDLSVVQKSNRCSRNFHSLLTLTRRQIGRQAMLQLRYVGASVGFVDQIGDRH